MSGHGRREPTWQPPADAPQRTVGGGEKTTFCAGICPAYRSPVARRRWCTRAISDKAVGALRSDRPGAVATRLPTDFRTPRYSPHRAVEETTHAVWFDEPRISVAPGGPGSAAIAAVCSGRSSWVYTPNVRRMSKWQASRNIRGKSPLACRVGERLAACGEVVGGLAWRCRLSVVRDVGQRGRRVAIQEDGPGECYRAGPRRSTRPAPAGTHFGPWWHAKRVLPLFRLGNRQADPMPPWRVCRPVALRPAASVRPIQPRRCPAPLRQAGTAARERPICREIFRYWSAKITVQYEDLQLNREHVIQFAQHAGFQVGIGDWRPKYGRFTVACDSE